MRAVCERGEADYTTLKGHRYRHDVIRQCLSIYEVNDGCSCDRLTPQRDGPKRVSRSPVPFKYTSGFGTLNDHHFCSSTIRVAYIAEAHLFNFFFSDLCLRDIAVIQNIDGVDGKRRFHIIYELK
jgi:hypothetical protein